jgi:hypothetical protein
VQYHHVWADKGDNGSPAGGSRGSHKTRALAQCRQVQAAPAIWNLGVHADVKYNHYLTQLTRVYGSPSTAASSPATICRRGMMRRWCCLAPLMSAMCRLCGELPRLVHCRWLSHKTNALTCISNTCSVMLSTDGDLCQAGRRRAPNLTISGWCAAGLRLTPLRAAAAHMLSWNMFVCCRLRRSRLPLTCSSTHAARLCRRSPCLAACCPASAACSCVRASTSGRRWVRAIVLPLLLLLHPARPPRFKTMPNPPEVPMQYQSEATRSA